MSAAGAQAADLSLSVSGPSAIIHNQVRTFVVHPLNGNAYPLPSGVTATVTITGGAHVTVLATGPSPGWICGSPTVCTYAGGRPVNTAFPALNVTVLASGHGAYNVCAHITYIQTPAIPPDPVPANNVGCAGGHIPPFP